MNCSICGKPIILVPTAAQRAAKDPTGKTAQFYSNQFTSHTDCFLKQRTQGTLDLIRSGKLNYD